MPKINQKKDNIMNTLEGFMCYCVEKDLTIKTRKSYESSLRLFFSFLKENYNICSVKDITKEHVKDYLDYTKERGKYTFTSCKNVTNNPSVRKDFGKKVSLITINGYLRCIKVFLNYCVYINLISTNPSEPLKYFKTTRRSKSDITDSDFKTLLSVINTSTFSGYRDYILINLLMDTGMRISETLALTEKDININNCTIYLNATITKSRKDRIVYFGSKMQRLLIKWLRYKNNYMGTDLLFCSNRINMLKPSSLETNLRGYCKKAGITKDITFHVFRNNFAKRYLASGGSIYILSQLLGHSSVTVTEIAYADLLQEDIKRNYISPLSKL